MAWTPRATTAEPWTARSATSETWTARPPVAEVWSSLLGVLTTIDGETITASDGEYVTADESATQWTTKAQSPEVWSAA